MKIEDFEVGNTVFNEKYGCGVVVHIALDPNITNVVIEYVNECIVYRQFELEELTIINNELKNVGELFDYLMDYYGYDLIDTRASIMLLKTGFYLTKYNTSLTFYTADTTQKCIKCIGANYPCEIVHSYDLFDSLNTPKKVDLFMKSYKVEKVVK